MQEIRTLLLALRFSPMDSVVVPPNDPSPAAHDSLNDQHACASDRAINVDDLQLHGTFST